MPPLAFFPLQIRPMLLTLIFILIITAVITWLVSGYDSRVTGHDKTADFIRRGSRCGITLIFVGIGSWLFMGGGIFGAFICIILLLPLAPFWMGCVSEMSSR